MPRELHPAPVMAARRPLVRFIRMIGLLCLLASALGLLLRASGAPINAAGMLLLVGLGIGCIAWTAILSRRAVS